MTGLVLLFAMLALLLIVWVLRRNAQDRETFEKELEQERDENGEGRD